MEQLKKHQSKIFISLIVFLPTLLFADIIQLKNGKTLSGKIIGQTRTTVRIKTKSGIKTVSKKIVTRLIFGVSKDKLAKEPTNKREIEKQFRQEEDALKKRKLSIQSAKTNTMEPKDYLWRSAFLPGWGQIERGDTWRGGAIGTGFVVGLASMYYYKTSHITAQATYNSEILNGFLIANTNSSVGIYQAFIKVPDFQKNMSSQAKNFETASIFVVLLYFYNTFDAGYFTDSNTENAKSISTINQPDIFSGFNLLLQNDIDTAFGTSNKSKSALFNESVRLDYTFRF